MHALCCWLVPLGFGIVGYAGIYCLIAGAEAIANHQWFGGKTVYLEGALAHGAGIAQVGVGAATLAGLFSLVRMRLDWITLAVGGGFFLAWTVGAELVGDRLNEGMYLTLKRKYKVKPKRADWPWPER
jgi:hypothetical protein